VSGDCLCLMLGLPCECTRSGPGGYGYRPHGTPAAARRHYRHGEPLCTACKQAELRHWQDVGSPARETRRRQVRQAAA
jgi:hypothetical protein